MRIKNRKRNQHTMLTARDRRIKVARAMLNQPSMTLVDISKAAAIYHPYILHLLEEMLRCGDVEQRQSPHHRFPRWALTARGAEVAELKLDEEGGRAGWRDDALVAVMARMPVRVGA